MASDPQAAGKNEKIIAEFQALRNEQKNLANNICTYEMDLKEIKLVIDTLKSVDDSRRCFRLIGGVLCERTVKDVMPQLTDSQSQLEKHIAQLTEQLTKKGTEINKFKEEHNIRVGPQEAGGGGSAATAGSKAADEQSSRNVLVAN